MVPKADQAQGNQKIDFLNFSAILKTAQGRFLLCVQIRAISLVVEQRSPKPLAGVRFPHRPPCIYSLSNICKTQFIIASTIPNRNAHQKFATVNPGTTQLARSTNRAFITKIKSPRVTTVIGRVRKTKIGRKIIFIAPNTTANTNAVSIPSTCTPGNKYAVTNIAKAETSQFIIVFIITLLYHGQLFLKHQTILFAYLV